MEISPGKSIRFQSNPTASTSNELLPAGFDPVTPDGMLPYPSLLASYAVSVPPAL